MRDRVPKLARRCAAISNRSGRAALGRVIRHARESPMHDHRQHRRDRLASSPGRRRRSASSRCSTRIPTLPSLHSMRRRRARRAGTCGPLRDVRRQRSPPRPPGCAPPGVQPGHRVLLMMRNRPDFHWFDMAAQFLRATPVSIYNSSSPEEIQYLASHAEAEIAIVEDAGFLERMLKVRGELPAPASRSTSSTRPPTVCPDGRPPAERPDRRTASLDLHELAAQTSPDDIATLIYTSGTTGPAEGRDDQPVQRRVHGRAAAPLHRLRRLRRQARRQLPADGPHRRADDEPLPVDDPRLQRLLLPRPEPARRRTSRRSGPRSCFGVPRVWEKIYNGVNAALAANPETQGEVRRGPRCCARRSRRPSATARPRRSSSTRGRSSTRSPSPTCARWSGSTRSRWRSPARRRSRASCSSGTTRSASRSARSTA